MPLASFGEAREDLTGELAHARVDKSSMRHLSLREAYIKLSLPVGPLRAHVVRLWFAAWQHLADEGMRCLHVGGIEEDVGVSAHKHEVIESADDVERVFGAGSLDDADGDRIATFMRRFRQNFPASLAEDRERRSTAAEHLAAVTGAATEHCWTMREIMREGLSWAATAVAEELNRADDSPDADRESIARTAEWHHVVMGLAVQGLDVLGEVITLVGAGYPDGALARVRTLHELAVVSILLTKHDDAQTRLVERFQAHTDAFLERTTRHLLATGNPEIAEMFDDEALATIRTKAAALEERFGKEFMRPNGWAAPAFPGGRPISFERMSQSVVSGLEFFYSSASNQVHAGSEAWRERVRRLEQD